MLGDITRTLQNISDHDAKLAKAIDDYFAASEAMLKAAQDASERYTNGQAVTAGKVTPETEVSNFIASKMGETAEQTIAATVQIVSAASSHLYLRRRHQQVIRLESLKGGARD